MRVVDVRTFRILRADRITHPLLVPRSFVHAIVVATAVRDGGFVKLRMEKNSGGGVLSAGGCSKNANARNVEVAKFFRGGFHPENAIFETAVFEILPANVVKSFGA